MGLGEKIKAIRKKYELTQQKFGDALNVKRSMIGAWEEERSEPGINHLIKLAELNGTTVEQFLNDVSPVENLYGKYATARPEVKKAISVLLNIEEK